MLIFLIDYIIIYALFQEYFYKNSNHNIAVASSDEWSDGNFFSLINLIFFFQQKIIV